MKEKHITSGRKKQKQNTRDKILEASRQLLEKKVTLTMENVAEKAGISRATEPKLIYQHAEDAGFPVTNIMEIGSVIGPKTAN